MYMPTYSEALELKKYLGDRGLAYVHFHDQCGSQFFSFDSYDEKSVSAVHEFWKSRGLRASFSDDMLRFIVTEE